MKNLFIVITFFVSTFNSTAQSNLSLYETVNYINTLLGRNAIDSDDVFQYIYKIEADRYGNIKFFTSESKYKKCDYSWFNINKAIDIKESGFVLPGDVQVKCNGNDVGCNSSFKSSSSNSVWPGMLTRFNLEDYEDKQRLAKAFKHLQSLVNDPFGE